MFSTSFLLPLLLALSFFAFTSPFSPSPHRTPPSSTSLSTFPEALSIFRARYPASTSPGTFYAISDSDAKRTYSAISAAYGETTTMSMFANSPAIMRADVSEIAPAAAIYKETYGEESARALLVRNPNLLFCTAEKASKAGGDAMALSYVIAATRGPQGLALQLLLLGLLLSPVVERVTGVHFGLEYSLIQNHVDSLK